MNANFDPASEGNDALINYLTEILKKAMLKMHLYHESKKNELKPDCINPTIRQSIERIVINTIVALDDPQAFFTKHKDYICERFAEDPEAHETWDDEHTEARNVTLMSSGQGDMRTDC